MKKTPIPRRSQDAKKHRSRIDITPTLNQRAINGEGLSTAPNRAGTFHIRATSVADATASRAIAIIINSVAVRIVPSTVTLLGGSTRTFNASVIGATNKQVAWSVVEGSTGGTVNDHGHYTALHRRGRTTCAPRASKTGASSRRHP